MFRLFRPTFFIMLVIGLVSQPVMSSQWSYETKGRVIAMSDIHGANDAFLQLVKGLGLVDEQGTWSGGQDHLVIVGDILDRGADSRQVLEMVMRLEGEAAAAGGRVHMLLGNHEIMNLIGDLRYVARNEFSRYEELEDEAVRTAAFEEYVRLREGGKLDNEELEAAFNKSHPPGFFAHQRLFSSKGEIGSWLLQRPVIVRVNDSVFVHGGLSPAVAGQSLAQINRTHAEALRTYTENRDFFIEKNILEFGTNFYEQPAHVKGMLKLLSRQKKSGEEEQRRAEQFYRVHNSAIFDDSSPTWYRGNVGCSAAIEKARLREVLKDLGASRLVIGHTPTATRTVESRFDEMVVRVDTGMLSSHYRGRPSAVVITDSGVETFYVQSDEKKTTVTPRRVGPRPDGLTDDQLEQVLSRAPIKSIKTYKWGSKKLQLANGDSLVESLSSEADEEDGVNILPGLAMYRIDRYLGMDLVPATVARDIKGDPSSVSLDLENLIDEKQRQSRQMSGAWCPLEDQFNMMYLLDLLAYNKGRKDSAMRYTSGMMNLILTNNDNLMGKPDGAPRYLKSIKLDIPPDVREKLLALDEAGLKTLLGDVLNEERIKALLSRRDRALKQAR